MKIKNINRKSLAGLLGAVILTTPLGLTACGMELNEEHNLYETINDYYVLTLETGNGKTIWLTDMTSYLGPKGQIYSYYDVFTGEKIFSDVNGTSGTTGVELLDRDNFQQYLVGYDYIKKDYTKAEIAVLFDKIKEDFYKDEKSNELVKK